MSASDNLSNELFGYHITSKKRTPAILKEGLKPQSNDQGYTPGVYLAKTPEDLEFYAGDARPNAHIFKVKVSKDEVKDDPDYSGAIFTEKPVPPENIKQVGKTNSKGKVRWK